MVKAQIVVNDCARDTAGVHQRAAESLQSFNVSSFCQNPTPQV